ncbi:MAG TPA: aminotransferase class I/II-fold pyridoxal phosphate-dependent enzyme, partial [Flavobacterium sp.]|nr:aminotransferase class I/II-fold pyridoxal phosphate-dependent enzyme [Flavobacterium sp.]
MAIDFNAINLSQGFPNFPIDEKMAEIIRRLAGSDVHQYTPMAGYPSLMEKIAKLTAQSYQRAINPLTELLITAGATEAIFATIQALVHSGDEVLI